MGAVTGRTTEPRNITIGTTNASAAITAAANSFNEEDAGAAITGTGIPAGATILSVQSGAAATLSANATATNAATVARVTPADGAYGFRGWSPESDAESEALSVAAKNAGTNDASRITSPTQAAEQRSRA